MAEVVAGTESEDNMSMSLQDLLGSHSHGGRRVKRKSVVEEPLVVDKVTLQKQRRMIKNRESAARSRERKQAYTVELESLVTHLEEENAVLLQLAVCMYLSIYAFSVLSCLYNILFSLVG
ncbi:hypothetical protein GLYMA_15G049000v4 [Glycine max]|uniref:BZIP domain-containing protein n=1 Tax=Glycine max TaxID=3847 RepID=I1MDS3_SOYBN|nr:hypothetical protein GLYMA_15G049000v4 [Glycine max]